MTSDDPQRSRFAVVVGLLAASYAFLVLVPPEGRAIAPSTPDASFVERLFPGVPTWWVGVRLGCAALVVVLAAWASPVFPRFAESAAKPEIRPSVDVDPWRLQFALAAAVALAIVGLWASHLPRVGQLAYVAWLLVPPALLVHWRRGTAGRPREWSSLVVVSLVVALWLVLVVPSTWKSPRSADLVDTWVGLGFLRTASAPDFNLLTDRFLPGSGSLHVMVQGGAWPSLSDPEVLYVVALAAHFLWMAVAGLGLGLLADRWLGRSAAAVATAAFLFGPFVLMTGYTTIPFFSYAVVPVGLLLLVTKVRLDRSVPALVGLGALAGVASTLHSANPMALVVLAAAGWSVWSWRPRPRIAILIALALFFAGAITGLEDLRQLGSIARTFSHGRAQWAAHELAAFGQISPTGSEYLVEAATPGTLDAPISALLSVVALPRTPLRSLGDALLDPFGGALFAIGIGAGLRAMAVSWFARLLFVVLAASLVPAMVSSTDRISLNRLLVVPVPAALFAGLGWAVLQAWWGRALRSTAAVAIAVVGIAAGGLFVFQGVNPRILPASWMNLTLQALRGRAPGGPVVVLDHPDPDSFPAWRLRTILPVLSPEPVTVRTVGEPIAGVFGADADGRDPELYFWPPGLEEDASVAEAVCRVWPGAALYTLTDEAGGSRVFAARPKGPAWEPSLPGARWRVDGCGHRLETEATRAAVVLAEARSLAGPDHEGERRELLRAAARQSFAQPDLFLATAEALLEENDPASLDEALAWALRASRASGFRRPDALLALAAAQARAGRWEEAVDGATRARELAVERGDAALVAEIDARVEAYRSRSDGG